MRKIQIDGLSKAGLWPGIITLLLALTLLPCLVHAAPIQFGPTDSYHLVEVEGGGGSILSGYTLQDGTDSYWLVNGPYKITTGDFNKDGYEDMVVVNGNPYYWILMNQGDGTFTKASYFVGDKLFDTEVVELYGDSIPDLVITDYHDNEVMVFTGNGDGTFNELASIPAGDGTHGSASGDFNGDGIIDVVTCNRLGNTYSVLLGNMSGSLNPASSYPAGGGCIFVEAGLVNSDSILDLVISNWNNDSFSVMLGDGAGGFSLANTISIGERDTDLKLGDFNGDSKLDLVIVSQVLPSIEIFSGDGLGNFTPFLSLPAGSFPGHIETHDLDGDGWLDLIYNNGKTPSALNIVLNYGSGNFSSPYIYHNDVEGRGLAVADFDLDGIPDIANACYYSGELRVIKGLPPDTDGDGIPDEWENSYNCVDSQVVDSSLDPDNDMLTNQTEYLNGSDPCVAFDADGDGAPDGWEDFYPCVDSLIRDSLLDADMDGLRSLDEYNQWTDPCNPDTDGDRMPDGYEVSMACLDPIRPGGGDDPDGDWLTSLEEYLGATDPCVFDDTDGDGIPDGWEATYSGCGLDPAAADSGNDPDLDGKTNLDEYNSGTNPCVTGGYTIIVGPDANRVRVTLLDASPDISHDIYLSLPQEELLIENSLKNVGKVANTGLANGDGLVFFVRVHAEGLGLGTYDHYSNTQFAKITEIGPGTWWIGFEDLPQNMADWDYDDVIILVELIPNLFPGGPGTNYLGESEMVSAPGNSSTGVSVETVDYNGLRTSVNLPAGLLNSPAPAILTIGIPEYYDSLMEGTGILSTGIFRKVLLTNGQTSLGSQAQITMEYPDYDQDGLVDGTAIFEMELGLFRYDSNSSQWVALPSQVFPDINQVTGQTDHFSLFSAGAAVTDQNLNTGGNKGSANNDPFGCQISNTENSASGIMNGLFAMLVIFGTMAVLRMKRRASIK